MASEVYLTPSTTGAVQFDSFLIDPEANKAPALALASNLRGRLRGTLKKAKRADAKSRDWNSIISTVEDYLPCLLGIIAYADTDTLLFKHEPLFSWRATLTSSKLKSTPRVSLPNLHYELTFTLLTLALAHCNAAVVAVGNLGDYERERHTSEAERKRLDEVINTAAEQLCRSAGIFRYLSETVIPKWERVVSASTLKARPAETTRELTSALEKMSLADAERLAIRRLLTRAVSDSAIAPGHPLPRTHPSPSLLAKLHINVTQLYDDAISLFHGSGIGSQPSEPIRRHAIESATSTRALAHKWLGVDAGERDKPGEAVAWLTLAKDEMKPLLKKSKSAGAIEAQSIDAFLTTYKRLNDTVSFQPIPKPSSLLAMVPSGRAALAVKAYIPPPLRFGSGNPLDLRMANLTLDPLVSSSDSEADDVPAQQYAGKGGYF